MEEETPVRPGFAEFKFEPIPCGLTFAHGLVPTPHGSIRVSWKLRDGRFHADLLIPPNTLAHTPAGDFGPGPHDFSWNLQGC